MKFKLKYEGTPPRNKPLAHRTTLKAEFSSDGESEEFEQSAYISINNAFKEMIKIIEGPK